MPGDKISKVYQQASEHWDMGTEDDFRQHVSDTNVINKLYDSLSAHYEMPEKQVFKSLFAQDNKSTPNPIPNTTIAKPEQIASKNDTDNSKTSDSGSILSSLRNFFKDAPRDGTDAKKTYPFYIPRGTKLGPRPIEYHDMENSKIFSQLEKQKQDAIRMNPKNKQFFNQ